jgi:predicted transposase YbfD/YdcC
MERFAATLSGQVGTAGQVVALDGKSLRGAVDAARRSQPLHLVTAWVAEQRLVLGLRQAPRRSEVAAARAMIALLDLTATTVTADALHGSRATAKAIRERGGDYALVIKGNRGPLHQAARDLFATADPALAASTTEAVHGRHETRSAWVLPVPDWAETYRFPALRAMARIDGVRRVGRTGQTQTRYIALSRVLEPIEALRVVRAHWSIENNQHWLLDVALAEDRIHTRNDRTAENLAVLRRLALNLLRADTAKGSIRLKIKRAAWSDASLLSLISQMR